MRIPPALVRNVTLGWGVQGRRWLHGLPALLEAVARDWDLELGTPYEPLSYNWVTRVRRGDGSAAVLKVGLGELDREAVAVAAYGGQGAVRLLAYDEPRRALLLECAVPGTVVSTLVPARDEEATAVFATVAGRLHRTAPPRAALPDLTTQGECFAGYLRRFPADGPLPRDLVVRAGKLFEELCRTATRRVVLHGDLHHDNILRAEREPWLAIDPHGVVGDPGYELGSLLFNPDPDRRDESLLALVPARLELLAAAMDEPTERVIAWGFVKAVLSEVWTTEGEGVPGGRALDVATLLAARL